ncbi:hypothetical protein PR568_000443 [Escherichia coli]|nr:hypothetical protein [Escherichia coli]
MKNKSEKKAKRRKGWIKDITEYERSIFVNMLNEAAMVKRIWVTKKEKHEVIYRFRDVVLAIREANKTIADKGNVVSEQKIVNEVDGATSDVVKVKKERKPRVRHIDNYGRLRRVSLSERKFINNAVSESTKAKESILTAEERRKESCVAREQICSQRKANQIESERTKARHAAVFEWKRPDSFRR